MIPKIIHFCWFGKSKKNDLILKCIESWKNHCPEYRIVEWTEENSELDNEFVQYALENKKWAFVADVVRLDVLIKYGGVYLDTDMLLLDNLDKFLDNECFLGTEEPTIISGGIIGAVSNSEFLKQVREYYNTIDVSQRIDLNKITIPIILSSIYKERYNIEAVVHSTKELKEITLFSSKYFYPIPNKDKAHIAQYMNYIDQDSVAVHLWNASWVEYNEFDYLKSKKYLKALRGIIKTILKGSFNAYYFKRLWRNYKNHKS